MPLGLTSPGPGTGGAGGGPGLCSPGQGMKSLACDPAWASLPLCAPSAFHRCSCGMLGSTVSLRWALSPPFLVPDWRALMVSGSG